MQRGSVTVHINVTDDAGREFAHAYDWAGGASEVQKLLTLVEDLCRRANVTPQEAATSTIARMPEIGIPSDPQRQQGMIGFVLWLVLTAPAEVGTVADKVSAGDHIEVELKADSRGINMKLSGGHARH